MSIFTLSVCACIMELEAAESIIPLAVEPANSQPNWMETTDDQCFLMLFIIGTYFGPDLIDENPKKSVFQRMAEGLSPYTCEQLAGSHLRTMDVERVYYYVLRKADQSVTVKLPVLRQFLRGCLFPPPADSISEPRQFPDLFPPHLHCQRQFKNRYKIIENIVFINDPAISYIKPEDVERFKSLAVLEDFLLDRDAARLYVGVGIGVSISSVLDTSAVQENGQLPRKSSRRLQKRKQENDRMILEDEAPLSLVFGKALTAAMQDKGQPPEKSSRKLQKRQEENVHIKLEDEKPLSLVLEAPYSTLPCNNAASVPIRVNAASVEIVGPAMLFLPTYPTTEEWDNIVSAAKNGIALNGTVAERQAGPLIGLVDIGVCEDAYLFRVSLPGVRKDERDFTCEVETDGRVIIKGVTTTGERLVFKESHVFEMQTQYLSPPGPFSVMFQLPGPVNPREFSGNFGSDGILEGIVMKAREKK